MSLKAQDRIYSSVKTLKSYDTNLSYDSDEDDDKKKKKVNKDNINETFPIEEYLKKENCTSFNLGTLPMPQKCFVCCICNRSEDKYICEYCYKNCHEICREMKQKKLEAINNKITFGDHDYKGIKEFYCLCGSEYKHNPPTPFISEFGPCDLIKLDKALKLENFFCENHKIQICSVCYAQCHNKCVITKSQKINIVNKNKRRPDKCLCKNDCHTSYNEVAFTFPLNEYQRLSGVHIWPIQILNILFNNKRTFHRLYTLFTSMLNKEEDFTEKEEKRFVSLLELFSNTFNRKFKTFYYHEDILMMFNYENLINYIPNLKPKDRRSDLLLKFRLMFILLFIHLRKDFQTVKCLTSVDFLCSTVLERIKYKTVLGKPNIYTDFINKKYNNEELMEEGHILKNIALDEICRLMEISLRYLDLEKYANEYEIGLKYLCFILKKMLLTKTELIKLCHHLSIFFNAFYKYVTSKSQNLYKLLNIFNGVVEIVFLISVSYNDLVIMEYLDKYKSTTHIESIKPLADFIHMNTLYGKALYKIVLKSCEILKRHYELIPKKRDENKNIYDFHSRQSMIINKDINKRLAENGALFQEKIVHLFTETLGLFSLADNIYYQQLNSISKEDLINYYYFLNRVEKNIWIDLGINDKNQIDKIIYDLKNNIESRFNYLFTSSYAGETLEINKKIYGDIYLFSQNIKTIMHNFYLRNCMNNLDVNKVKPGILRRRTTIKSTENGKELLFSENINNEYHPRQYTNYYTTNNSFLNDNREIEENSEIKDLNDDEVKKNQNIKKFWKKLASKNTYYTFLNEIILNTVTEEFVDILIISNLDEVISKILSFLSNRKYPNLLTYELLDIIFSTMSLYFFTKRGMEYFLMGKNLTRINKIINRFNYNSNNKNNNPKLGKNINDNVRIMSRTLDFLLDICKSIRINGLNIKYHKILQRFKKNLLEHITMFNIVSNTNLIEFAIHFKKIMKIFILLSSDYPYEEFNYIKSRCILIFKKNSANLFDKNIFFQIVHLLNNKKGVDALQTNNLDQSFQEKKILLSLYFTFFKLIAKNTFYFYKNNDEDNLIIDILFSFNNLTEIKNSFANNTFTLKQKYILLQYLRTIYFVDHLDEYEILDQTYPLSNSEFDALFRNGLIQTNINLNDLNTKRSSTNKALSNISQNILMKKYNQIKDLEILLDLYISEVKQFPVQIINNNIKYSDLYYKELLFDIKHISNFFYCQKKSLWGEFKLLFYRFVFEFLKNINSFYLTHKGIAKSYKSDKNIFFFDEEESSISKNHSSDYNNDESWKEELSLIDERINKMQSINFDVYNKRKIYCFLTESIDALIDNCEFNQKYNLQNFLKHYDIMAESNFTPFSLLETLDYEYFYDEEMEENNELIKHDHYLYKIENLKNSFFATFIDINNTSFLDVITSTSEENFNLDFRKIYIDYFLSFINSIEGNQLHKLEINLCILTKMMFYDSEGMQPKFTIILKDQYFFPNINNTLNKYMVLVLSLSKNIYAYELAGEITNLNKLIIQFIQALGEGFNFTYHDDIFHSKKKSDTQTNNTNDTNIINNNIERYEEEKNNKYAESFRNYGLKTFDRYNNNSPQIIELKKTIYDSIINNLKYALYKLDLDNFTDSELPYDKLIIFVTNIIDFIIEYIYSTDDNNDLIRTNFKRFLFGIKLKKPKNEKEPIIIDENIIIKTNAYLNSFFTKVKYEKRNKDIYLLRKKVICYTKIKLTQLLIYYSLTGGKEAFIEKLVENDFSTINLFNEILYNFDELLNNLEYRKPELIDQLKMQTNIDDYVNKLIDFYAYEEDFRNIIELQVVFQLFILIKIFEEIYKNNQLSTFFKKNIDNIEERTIDENGEFNLRSKFSRSIYEFLNFIILKVEVAMDDEDLDERYDFNDSENEDEEFIYKVNSKNRKNDRIARKIRNKLKNDRTFSTLININKRIKNDNNLENNILQDTNNNINNIPQDTNNNNINNNNVPQDTNINPNNNNAHEEEKTEELSSITENDEDDDEDDDDDDDEGKSNMKTIFFPRPYLTYFLSRSTKERFINTADRSSASSKFTSLLDYADYCLYEMIVNKHLIGSSKIKKSFANIDYSLVEIVNYIFIVVQNILILWRFYKRTDLPYRKYYTFEQSTVRALHPENMILAIVQICFLIFFLVIWYFFKFLNSCQYYIMKEYNRPFVGKRIGDDEKIPQIVVDYFQEKNVSTTTFFREVNKGVSKWQKFYIYVFSSHVLNREIIMLVLSLILSICYIGTKNPLFLVIQIVFVANISSTLFDIFYAIKLKWINIVLLLLFDFLCVYVFMWFAFFFFPHFFEFDEVLVPLGQETIREGFCYSSVQCYLFILDRGSLSNGGISNDLKKISYKRDVGKFMGRFFFDVLFFLLISLYIGKMFLSFIIDTFGELREINAQNIEDRDDKCYICQITRDECLMKNIDFETHIEKVHNMWNYVYFLNYLYLNNPLNFNWIENSVWEKLQEQGINWLPLKED